MDFRFYKKQLHCLVICMVMSSNEASAQVPLTGVYAGIEGGYSVSNNVDLHPQQRSNCVDMDDIHGCWFNPNQSFRSTFGQSSLFGVKLGYHINSAVDVEMAYDQRNSFNWYKNFPGNLHGGPNPSPIPRRREINIIRNQTLMTNINLISPCPYFCLYPYLTAGFGVAWNKLGDLTSVNALGSRATITGDTTQSFAWQIGAGIKYLCNQNLFFNLGYRFLNMGIFTSGTRDIFGNVNQPIGTLRANNATTNELFAGVNYNF